MVSRTPTKPSPAHKPRPAARRLCRKNRSPLKTLCAAPSAAAASIGRSLTSCRRRLIKIFARFAVLGTPSRHKRGFRRLKPAFDQDPSPSPPQAAPRSALILPPPISEEKKTIFLDLDETLVHSKTGPPPARYDFAVCPVIGGLPMTFYVLKRPGVDELLRAAAAAEAFEVVVFTAGLEEYAWLVLDQLDPDGALITHRLYRDSCLEPEQGKFIKDLSATGRRLDRAVIVDDNPNAYAWQPENAVPVAPFIGDLGDRELQMVIKFLEVAAVFEDTREAIRYYLSGCGDLN